MASFNPAISNYILKCTPEAQTILIELRAIVHSFCPDVTETIKWNFPHFEYKGAILCSMAGFKHHSSFGFWLASQLNDTHGVFRREEQAGMGNLGKITSLEELPNPLHLGELIQQAMVLIDEGVKLPKKTIAKQTALVIPSVLLLALEKHPAAKTVFDNFSPSHKREYVAWLNEAKTDATLNKRLDKTIANLLEGKL